MIFGLVMLVQFRRCLISYSTALSACLCEVVRRISKLNLKQMKKLALSILFVAFLGIAYADNEGTKSNAPEAAPVETLALSGTVLDFNSGETLTGVEVTIEGTDIKVYTDFDGKFEIGDVTPGNYNIIASYISYDKSLIENFKADIKNNEVDIKLQSSK